MIKLLLILLLPFGCRAQDIPKDTVIDQGIALNAMIKAAVPGSVIQLEAGVSYSVLTPVVINKPLTIEGNGSTIQYAGTALIAVVIRASNITIKNLTVKSTYRSSIPGSVLIGTEGTNNARFLSNITVENCTASDGAGSGILIRHTRNAKVINCSVSNMPYIGIGLYSVIGGRVQDNEVADITSLGIANAYGITINNTSVDSTARDVLVQGNYVYRVPWEGYDTHGGESITFDSNYAIDCAVGFAIVSTKGKTPTNIVVTNNTIRSKDYNSSGIRIMGAGAPLYAKVTVSNNTLIGQHIRLELTTAAIISNNKIYQSGTSFGIYLSGDNINASITGNEIIDVFSPSGGNSYAIFFSGNNNIAGISGNILSATPLVLPAKNRYGFSSASNLLGCMAFIGNNEFSAATMAQYRNTSYVTFLCKL